MSRQIDDISLILSFIKGDEPYASNRRLRIQPALDVLQLMTVSGKLIAWAKHGETPAKIGIRPLGDYAELLRNMLPENEFMPVNLDPTGKFLEYEYHPIPIGHEMRFGLGREFWKYWWANRKRFIGPKKDSDLLVFTQRQWQTVTQVSFHMSTLYITTLEGGTALRHDDHLVWIRPKPPETEEDKTVFWVNAPSEQQTLPSPPRINAGMTSVATSPTALSFCTSVSDSSGPPPNLQIPTEHDGKAVAQQPKPTLHRANLQSPLDYVHQCSEQEWVIETPGGFLVITGQNMTLHTQHPAPNSPPQTA